MKRVNRGRLAASFLLAMAVVAVPAAGELSAQEPAKESRWEPSIRAFEAADREHQPPKEGILFVGSSSIRGWDLDEYFSDLPVINRGFGGSQIADSVEFADRIILPYRPKIIALYAGDNDVNAGKSPQQVLTDYKAFVAKVHGSLPGTRIVFIAIKPSISRWKLVGKMREANRLIRKVTEKDPTLVYLDVDTPMIGPDAKPRPELFKDDGLHLNAVGYKLWSDLIRPHLKLE